MAVSAPLPLSVPTSFGKPREVAPYPDESVARVGSAASVLNSSSSPTALPSRGISAQLAEPPSLVSLCHLVAPIFPLPRKKKSEADRFITPRSVLKLPGAVGFDMPPLPPAVDFQKKRAYESALNKAFFGSSLPLSDYPVLRKAPPFSDTIPSIPASEVYSDFAISFLDCPRILDDFCSMPIALCKKTDKIAAIVDKTGHQVTVALRYPNREQVIELPQDVNYNVGNTPISVAFNEKGSHLAVGKKDGSIEVWSVKTDPIVKEFEINPADILEEPATRINSVLIHNHKIFAGDVAGRVYQIDPKTGKVVKIASRNKEICNMVASPAGNYLAIGGDDRKVVLYDAHTFKIVHEFEMGGAIRAIAFDPKKECRIAVGGGRKDPRVCIFNFSPTEREKPVEIFMGNQITNIVWEQPKRMITTHSDGTFRVIPLSLGSKDPHGSIVSVQAGLDRIIYCAITGEREKTLMCCLGGCSERLAFFPLPKEKSKKQESESILDNPFLLSLR